MINYTIGQVQKKCGVLSVMIMYNVCPIELEMTFDKVS